MRELAILPTKRFQPRRYRPGNLGTWSGHLPFAHDIVAATQPSVLVELGTHFGESYFGFCQAVEENSIGCKCYAVDTWRGDEHARYYDEDVFREVDEYNRNNYSSFSSLIRDTFDRASGQFGAESIDLLHIDGLHTYEAVKHDWETWLPKMRPGGIVLLHDINARHADFGVWKLWEELQSAYRHFEFTHFWGLGVVQTGHPPGDEPNLLRFLFQSGKEDRHAIREQYATYAEYLELSHRRSGELHLDTNRTNMAQVFAGRHGGFNEEHSATSEIQPGEWQLHQFKLAKGFEVGTLRIDPVDCPALVDLASVSIRTAVDEAGFLIRISDPADIRALRLENDLLPIGDGIGARFLSFGRDPYLILDLPHVSGLGQSLVVELQMRVELGDAAVLLEKCGAVHTAEVRRIKGALDDATGERFRMEAERTLALGRVESLASEVRLYQAERLVQNAEQRRLAGMREALQAENEEVLRELRREQDLRIATEKERSDLRKEAEQLRWTLENQLTELAELRPNAGAEEVTRDLREEIRNERRRREEIEASYSWRITGPVRRALRLLGGVGARRNGASW